MPAAATASPTRTRGDLLAAARALGASSGGVGAARVLSLLYDPDVEVTAVLDCLHADPGLAARVLKVANAPYYRQAGHIGTVDRAVAVLGLTAIRGVAASGCLDRLTPPRSGTGFDPERFRLHSLAVACAARQLSDFSGAGIASEAYMAGLLHDIGWLLLVKVDPAAMARYVPPTATQQTADHACAMAAEQAHFGATHEACALLLTQAWALPGWLAHSIAGHHAAAAAPGVPPTSGLAGLPALLALADHAALAAGFGLHADAAVPTASAALAGCRDDQLQALIAALPDTLAALQTSP